MCTGAEFLALGAAQTVTSSVSAFQQARAQKDTLKARATVARRNQELAAIEEANIIRRGNRAEQAVQRDTRNLSRAQRAAFSGRGIDVNFGTPLDIVAGTEVIGEFDAGTTRENTANARFGAQVRGQGFQTEAAFLDTAAGNISPANAAASTLLSGATSTALNYQLFKNRKIV